MIVAGLAFLVALGAGAEPQASALAAGALIVMGLSISVGGALTMTNSRGQADKYAAAFWRRAGLHVASPRLQSRIIGGATLFIGVVAFAGGVANLLS